VAVGGEAKLSRPSAEGFVRLIQEALGPSRRHEAIFTTMQFAPGYEFNAFDLQVGCEYPLPLEKAFLQNFLALLTLPPDETTPFEGMAQMVSLVIDEAYRRCTEVPGGAPKRYRKGSSPWSTRQSTSMASVGSHFGGLCLKARAGNAAVPATSGRV
jgi:hypothetical protein